MKKTVIPLCTGNICRSAMAEVVLKTLLSKKHIDDIEVLSRAISSEEQGNPIDYRAEKILLQNGYNRDWWKYHSARKITQQEIETADLILPMTHYHFSSVVRQLGGDENKVFMYRCFEHFDKSIHTAEDLDDPWYGGMSDFEKALRQIEYNSEKIVEWLKITI